MSEINNKPWERPWSPEEMISNASTWSLAGDAGVLKYLEEFSKKMISNIRATNDRLNDLIENTNETSIALNNATNEFMGLRNTQFIESRVYEDDETLPQKPKPEPQKPHIQTDIDRLNEMKNAILNGLEIIDKYYEKVEIPESDSDDDIDEPSIVYRPIDPYMHRPLPYVIGTAEWHKYWHVGLAHSSSSSETENDDEEFSESDMEAVLPQRESQISGVSDTESDDLLKSKVAKPVANSTFNDNTNRNMFESSSDSETGSLPPQVNTINNNFAEELAAKLGKVEAVKEPEVNTKPIKKPTNISVGLFSDEPPPLDEDDIFVNKNMKSGLFSGGEGLFDDNNDDTDFWNTKTSTITKITPVVEPKPKPIIVDDKDIFNDTKINKPTTSQQKPLGLFDDEDDLFSKASVAQSKKTILTPFKTAPPLFNEEPPELESPTLNETKRKKPIGGVSMLGPGNSLTEHFDKIIKKRAPSTSDSDSEKETSHPVSKASQVIKTPTYVPQTPIESKIIIQTLVGPKKIDSIFDDNSPLFTDDIFGETSSNNTSSLFDSKTPEKVQPEKPKLKQKPVLAVSEPSSVAPNPQMLIDDEDLFSKPPELPKSEKSLKNFGLFDDDLEDDLFSFNNNTNSLAPKAPKSINLFDPNPPELDESDAKSDKSQISLENEPSTFDTLNTGRVSLFDNEPPLLSNESSGIVKDQSTRLESSDSSFLPTMTSSRHHSTDLFQENQCDDSLFITKAKPPSDTNLLVKSDLSLISELDTPTKIDITPSGVQSSLFDQSSIEKQSTDSDTKRASVDQKSLDPLGSFESSLPIEDSSKNQYLAENQLSDQSTTVEPKIISLFGERDNKIPKIADKPKQKIASLLEDSDSDDDLFSNKSATSKHSDIMSNTPSNPLKTKHIFEDDLFHGPNLAGVPEVDLFTKNKRIETEVSKHRSINKKFDYEDNLKTIDKTDPKKPLNISNKDSEEVDGQISSSTSPGKLKLNFNINVAALLPGASPPRRQNLEKSTSFDSSENTQKASPIENVHKSVEILPTQQKTPDNSLSYNEPIETDSILPRVAKERVRIQVKRRPSTRKARHEAIRKSAIDLNFDDQIPEIDNTLAQNFNNTSDEQANKPSSKTILNINNLDIENPLQSSDQKTNPLSPSTDEEDVFSMPQESFDSQDDSSSLFDAKQSYIDTKPIEFLASSVKTKQASSIFSSSDSENDLFGSTESELKKPELKDDLFKPVAEPVAPVVTAKSNMLQWDDNLSEEEDDIFSSKKLPLKSSVLKKSLFEDDDEDDIFKEASSKASSSKSQSSYSKVKKIGMTRVKKLTADVGKDIDDPLDALKN